MPQFIPCRGKQACVEQDDHCITCGRSLDEIARTRQLIEQLTEFALQQDYDNLDDFANNLGEKMHKKVHHRRENTQ